MDALPQIGKDERMRAPHFLSIPEQAAVYLRGEVMRGRWAGLMPGIHHLAPELGVNAKTVDVALRLLEKEGLLVPQGPGRRRQIVLPKEGLTTPALRVALMLPEVSDRGVNHMLELRYLLEDAGHLPFFPDKTLNELGMDVGRVSRFVKRSNANAWVVGAGSREVLAWFAEQEFPAFAFFGSRSGLPMAGIGPDKAPVMAEVVRKLVSLGHRRISCLIRHQHRLPEPSGSVRSILDELEAAGIQTGEFNLPDWKEDMDGFKAILDSLFGVSCPTALILDEAFLYYATLQYLAMRGLRVPGDVSLVCTDGDAGFLWCRPTVAHIRWDAGPVVRRIVRWANNIARGKNDCRQSFTKAEFVKGGTIGAVPKGF